MERADHTVHDRQNDSMTALDRHDNDDNNTYDITSSADAIYTGTAEVLDSLLYLAEYSKNECDYNLAEGYCNRLLDLSSTNREAAKALMQEIRQLKTYHQQQKRQGQGHGQGNESTQRKI